MTYREIPSSEFATAPFGEGYLHDPALVFSVQQFTQEHGHDLTPELLADDRLESTQDIRGIREKINEKIIEDESYRPEALAGRINRRLVAHDITERYPHNPHQRRASTNEIVSRDGARLFNLDRLNKTGLDPVEMLTLMGGAYIASYNRGEEGNAPKITRRIRDTVEHLATNLPLRVKAEATPEQAQRLLRQVSLHFYSNRLLTLLADYRASDELDTIKDIEAIIRSGVINLTESTSETPDTEVEVEGGATQLPRKQFVPVFYDERARRMGDFDEVVQRLRVAMPDVEDLAIFQTIERKDLAGKNRKPPRPEDGEDTEENGDDAELANGSNGHQGSKTQEQERENWSTSDTFDEGYIFAVFSQKDHTGGALTHIVAESPFSNDACYILDGRVIKEWERLLGVPINWREIFGDTKLMARQYGARQKRHRHFTHEAVPLAERITDTLNLPYHIAVGQAMDQLVGRNRKQAMTDDFNFTDFNRLPDEVSLRLLYNKDLFNNWQRIRQEGYASYILNRGTVSAGRILDLSGITVEVASNRPSPAESPGSQPEPGSDPPQGTTAGTENRSSPEPDTEPANLLTQKIRKLNDLVLRYTTERN